MELIIPCISTIWHVCYQRLYSCVSPSFLFVSFSLVWNGSEKDVLHLGEGYFMQLNRTVGTTIVPKGRHGWIKTYSGDEMKETITGLAGNVGVLNKMLWAKTRFKLW